MSFLERVSALPTLGIGVSTEYGAFRSETGLDIHRLQQRHPEFAAFLEVGVETLKGLDEDAQAWVMSSLPTTYHFLDVNLDEPSDFDDAWMASVHRLKEQLRPAWMCGDAGLWHFGARERGHMLLLPPILSAESAKAMAAGIQHLRQAMALEVLPENPPGRVFLGDLHLLEFYAQVCDHADTGQLLDCAHLAVYQRQMGYEPLDGLADFPLDHIVELHVAGGSLQSHDGFEFIEDDHSVNVLDATWEIFEHVVPRCPNLKAVVFECERNPLEDCLPGFTRIHDCLKGHAAFHSLQGDMKKV
ncbi:MAG: DUF692 family multinuclear iron-containing protein [Myxococcota bacterium]|nr:DUF692 family multinuclear iron-containing protein [Myxococcota bacterium]